MIHRLLRALWGGCAVCQERQARIDALEARLSDLLDRLMSRDYSHVAFVRAQTAPVLKTGDGDELDGPGDGLDA